MTKPNPPFRDVGCKNGPGWCVDCEAMHGELPAAPKRRTRASVPWLYKIYQTFHGKEYHYNTCPCERCATARTEFREQDAARREREREQRNRMRHR